MPLIANRNYLFSILLAASAHADTEDVISQCARFSSPDERILCLENALRQDSGSSVEIANAVPTSEQTIDAEETIALETDTHETEISNFGLPDEQKNPDPVTSIEVVVVKISKTAYGKLIFTTADGQVWIQTDRNSPRYKSLPVDMTIRDGASGSYFIQPSSGGVAVRVKRRQ